MHCSIISIGLEWLIVANSAHYLSTPLLEKWTQKYSLCQTLENKKARVFILGNFCIKTLDKDVSDLQQQPHNLSILLNYLQM
jgi:hypothetical protein